VTLDLHLGEHSCARHHQPVITGPRRPVRSCNQTSKDNDMSDVLDPRSRPANCPTRLGFPVPPKDQPIYRFGTTVMGGILYLTSSAGTGDIVLLQFDKVPAGGSSVVIDVQEGWTIESFLGGTWTQNGNLWTLPLSPQTLASVVAGGAVINFFFFVQQSSGRRHDPVVIVERPPSVYIQPSPTP
jgi:hypothetical protein